MEPAIRTDVRATLTAAVRAGGIDAAQTLAWAVPVRTVSRLLGLPVGDEPMLRGWLQSVIQRTPEHDRLPPAAHAAGAELRSYFADHAQRRRRASSDDLLGDVVAAQRRCELDAEEIPGLCLLLYVAGTETVADFIGNALVVLAEHPEQRAALAAEPARASAAVEELLRFESPVQYQVRSATAATELHGVTIPAGSAVALLWGAANRDERRWVRPDELDLTREARLPARRNARADRHAQHAWRRAAAARARLTTAPTGPRRC
jgi:cytochrome P450